MNLQTELIEIKREVRDLKTAQTLPSWFAMHTVKVPLPAGTYSGSYTWTIQYEDVGDSNAPLTVQSQGAEGALLVYDEATNTQKHEWTPSSQTIYQDIWFNISSTRPIASVTPDF